MDQGVAAVIAGIAGVIGTGVGGLATAYGARIGAQKSMEAVQVQVREQSEAEHSHWVREQRRQACVELTDALGAFAKSVAASWPLVLEGRAVPHERFEALMSQTDSMLLIRGHTQLWGPQPLTDTAHRLTEVADELRDLIERWQTVTDNGNQDEVRQCQQEWESKVAALKSARADFVIAARLTLAEAPQPS